MDALETVIRQLQPTRADRSELRALRGRLAAIKAAIALARAAKIRDDKTTAIFVAPPLELGRGLALLIEAAETEASAAEAELEAKAEAKDEKSKAAAAAAKTKANALAGQAKTRREAGARLVATAQVAADELLRTSTAFTPSEHDDAGLFRRSNAEKVAYYLCHATKSDSESLYGYVAQVGHAAKRLLSPTSDKLDDVIPELVGVVKGQAGDLFAVKV